MKGVILVVGFLLLEAAFLFHAALPVNAGLLLPEHRPVTARKTAPAAPVAPAHASRVG